jgi:hypothetical protein
MFRPVHGIPPWIMFVSLGFLVPALPGSAQVGPEGSAEEAEEPEPGPPGLNWTFSAGLGQTYGGVGGALEFYLADARASLGLGAGRLPDGPGFGMTARVFFGSPRTRGWVETSVSLLNQETEGGFFGPVTEKRDLIGPGVAGGLRLMPTAGLTLTLGAGAGYAGGRTIPMINLGVGWSTLR